jgi:hypothetical protein
MYIKALEQEVLRLKEVFTDAARERDAFAEENRRLKEILMAHGISYDLSSPSSGLQHVGSSYGGSSTGSVSGGYTNSTGYTSPPSARGQGSLSAPPGQANLSLSPQQTQQQNNCGLDYDQLGIDFVLAYDRKPYLSPPPQL